MKKSVLVIALALLVGFGGLTADTLAHFTGRVTAHNVITTGSIGIHVEEHQLVNGKLEPYPTTPVKVMPGDDVSKIVTIHNDHADSFVRACVEIVLTDAQGNVTVLSPDGVVSLNINSTKWLRKSGDSKWWYYDGIVESHGATEALFDTVNFDGAGIGNRFQGATIEIHIAAQAVQAANNGTEVLKAQGWPGETIA